MPRQGSRPRKWKFRGNLFLYSAKKPRVVESVNNDSMIINDTTELSEQSTSTEADHAVSTSARKIGTQNPQVSQM